MVYQISEQLISYNRSYKALQPQGFVIHDTDDVGATAQNEHDYFNSGDRQASAHYFTDWNNQGIIRTIPESEQAWHAGSIANSRFLSVEMCCPNNHDVNQFQEVWNKTVWLVADACIRYGWTTDVVWSHKGISDTFHQTDHQDPYSFIQSYGKTWSDLLSAINQEINNIKNNNQGDDFSMDCAILYFTPSDYSNALIIANLNGGCGMYCRNGNNASVHLDIAKSKKVFVIGGGKIDHPNQVYLSGNTAGDTLILIANYLKGN